MVSIISTMYGLLRRFVVFCLSNFFRSIRIMGSEPINRGALLVVPNHPNHMLDPLLMVYTYERPLWFLAKATLFKFPPVAFLLKLLHMVPVYRRHDDPSETVKNKETFRVVEETLTSERAIVLFPEGVSMGERKLYPLKTGAARMAFQAEQARDFKLGLLIQPVGITYTDLLSYRSAVTITLGKPLTAGDFKGEFEQDEYVAVRSLTDKIEESIRELSVEVHAQEFATLAEKIGALYESISLEPSHRARLKEVARQVEMLAPQFPDKAREIEADLDRFLALGEALGVRTRELPTRLLVSKKLIFFSPLILWGAVFHFIPYTAIAPLATKLSSHPVDTASRKFSTAVVLFPLWYALAAAAALGAGWRVESALGVVIISLISGMLCHRYGEEVKLFLLSALWPGKKSPVEILLLMRDDLIKELEQLRNKGS